MRDSFKLARGLLLSFAALLSASSVCAQISPFAANEMRAAGVKDRLHGVQINLKDGSTGAKNLSIAVTEAFKGTDDWAPAAEAFYARKKDLTARAAKLEARLDAAIARNAPERADDVTASLDPVIKSADTLRSDYEFYMGLPRLAMGPQRQAAQAAMRLIGQTGDYPLSLAYFLDKTPSRPPFAPLPPGVMSIRHK